ncbi:MAG: hypothetical protein ACE5H4_14245 [Candidatus Thorarchaeota archaeon]
MNLLIPGILLGVGFAMLIVDLVFLEEKSLGEALLTMQFGIPERPLGILANVVIIVSAIALVLAYTGII